MTAPLPPIWIAAPPEVHSTLLNFGGTPIGIEIAATSWKDLMAQYAAAVAELEGILAEVQGTYQGPSAERFVATHQPYLVWLSTAAAKAGLASAAHDEIAAAYTGAVAAMPTMGELMSNHVIHGVLVGTNFFGCNTIPIGMNEADYVRMWILAADVMTGWDGASTAAADSIPLTPPSPILVVPGVSQAGDVAAATAGFSTQAEGEIAGSALTSADLMGTKLEVGKAISSPASLADGASPDAAARGASREGDLEQNLDMEKMAPGMLQQFASMVPSAAQSALSGLQGGGPQQVLSSAPQLLSSAPQTLGQLLTGFTGSGLDGQSLQPGNVMPVGFSGTTAMKGLNPAGLTNLAGGVFDSGPSRPVLPSTWGPSPTTTAQTEMASVARGPAAAAGFTGTSASGSGGGGAMLGSGAQRRNAGSSRAITAYADDAGEDESDIDPDVRGLTL